MELISRAGPFLWPILLCSVVGLALFLDRVRALYRIRSSHEELIAEAVPAVARGSLEDAREACKNHPGPAASVVTTLLGTLDLPPEERDPIVTVAGNLEIRRLERGLRGIAVIARISPLLGLLGTVVGLVEAFRAVSTMLGPPDPSVLASGIWQALLTTVAGLLVAIPAIVSHEWLRTRIDDLTGGMQEAVTEVLAAHAARRRADEVGD